MNSILLAFPSPLGFVDAQVQSSEVFDVRGVKLKVMRLSDVIEYNMTHYMGDEHAHKFRIMVSNLDTHSDAYHAKSIRPGDIIKTINNQQVPDTWDKVLQVLLQ